MPKEERKISPAVLIIPFALGLAALGVVAALALAAPPKVYTCPYCGAEFATEEELLAHIELEHPEMVAKFVYVSPLTVILNWPLDAWVDIQNQGGVAGECAVIFGMREYHAQHDIWSAWYEWPPIIAVLQPGEIHRFSLSTEYSAPLSQQIKVESPAGILLEPPEPGL